MVSMIRKVINMYMKANGLESATTYDYPTIIDNLFGEKISLSELNKMTGKELMDRLIKKESI